jgi:hypothetical protein
MSEEFGITPRRTRPRSGAAPSRARRRPSTKLLTAKLAALSTAGALVIGGWLAVQMASGDDPALGPKAAAKSKAAATTTTTTPLESTAATQSAASTGSNSTSTSSSQDQASVPAPVTTRAS